MNPITSESIIKNLLNYINFLEREFNLNISIHDFNCFLQPYNSIIGKYNTHSHPFCMYVKSHKPLWDKCFLQQKKVLAHCLDEVFYGMCYCGVEEYIIPIILNGRANGFICATGYCVNKIKSKKRIIKNCDTYNLNVEKMLEMQSKLSSDPPKPEFIKNTLKILADMLSLVCKDYYRPTNDKKNRDYIYANILAYLENNYAADVSVSKIAKFCHCSESYINHIFKQQSGININAYVNNLRISKAKYLLKNSSMQISEIAYNVGFNDSNYFSNLFKKNIGIPPGKYRKINYSLIKE